MNESVPKPRKEENEEGTVQSRRAFLKTAATVGGSALVAGLVGRAAGEKVVTDFSKKSAESLQSNPAQELVNQRHAKYMESVAVGDPETINVATGLIGFYEEELKGNIAMQTALALRLVRSELGSGSHTALQDGLFFLKQRQEEIVRHIDSLKDPIHQYLKNKKSGPRQETGYSDDEPTAPPFSQAGQA